MSIYILDTDPAKCAQALDDKSLDKQIKAIAQVLCNVHWFEHVRIFQCQAIIVTNNNIKLPPNDNKQILVYSKWASECVANYKYLVDLLDYCLEESIYRHDKEKFHQKYSEICIWASDNVPNLPNEDRLPNAIPGYPVSIPISLKPFPLVMPEKYIVRENKVLNWKIYGGAEKFIGMSTINFKDNIEESYRSYYAEQVKCKNCTDGLIIDENVTCDCCDPFIGCDKCPSWTRREKPEWLIM